jgi:hypothetical protein
MRHNEIRSLVRDLKSLRRLCDQNVTDLMGHMAGLAQDDELKTLLEQYRLDIVQQGRDLDLVLKTFDDELVGVTMPQAIHDMIRRHLQRDRTAIPGNKIDLSIINDFEAVWRSKIPAIGRIVLLLEGAKLSSSVQRARRAQVTERKYQNLFERIRDRLNPSRRHDRRQVLVWP